MNGNKPELRKSDIELMEDQVAELKGDPKPIHSNTMTKPELEQLEDDVTILEGGTPRPHHNTLRIDELRVLQDRVEELIDGGDGFDVTLSYSLAEGYESRQLYGLIIANDNVELVEDKWEYDDDIQAYTPLGGIKFIVSNGVSSVELSGKDLGVYFDESISHAWVLGINFNSYSQEVQDFYNMITENYNSVLGLSYTLSSEAGLLKSGDQLNKAKTITWVYGEALDSEHDYPVDRTINLYDTTLFSKESKEDSGVFFDEYTTSNQDFIDEIDELLPYPSESAELTEVLFRMYPEVGHPLFFIADSSMDHGALRDLNSLDGKFEFDSDILRFTLSTGRKSED